MSYPNGVRATPPSAPFPASMMLTAWDLAGVRRRRMFAVLIDVMLVSVLVMAIWIVLALGTLGLALFILPPLYPIVAFFYNGLTVSGVGMGTWGQRMVDLEVRMAATGARVPFLNAAVHGVLFYVSWMFPPIFLVSLVAHDKRCLHDMLAGLIVLRRKR